MKVEQSEQLLKFSSFSLDVGNQCLRREDTEVPLTPKAFAVLRYLMEHSGRLVNKEELLAAAWPDTVVGEAVLKMSIRELRKALADDAKAPHFIETVHRRGYRFIAPLHPASPVQGAKGKGQSQREVVSIQYAVARREGEEKQKARIEDQSLTVDPRSSAQPFLLSPQHSALVGRGAELAQLHTLLEKALGGERQVVFVTGEPGIGKSTLIEAFLEEVRARANVWIGRGQCLDHYGAGEAYLPVLEALSHLCRAPDGDVVRTLLQQCAPTWLTQMPWLLSPADREELQRQLLGLTRERMLREMSEALRMLTIEAPLIVVLEDLHWSDFSTLDLVASLARRSDPLRLLLIGTYRPVDVIINEHPLKAVKQELQVHGQCTEVPLDFFTEDDVMTFLATRLPREPDGFSLARNLAPLLSQRTGGNPLFLTAVVDDLVARGVIIQQEGEWRLQNEEADAGLSIPENIRQMIEKQVERLSPDERFILEAASVVGVEFATLAVADAVGKEELWVEEYCERLARRGQFIRPLTLTAWPDGSLTMRYQFSHALYQNVVYDRVGAARRVRFHQRIGEREERAYGERASERAVELARHFELGRDGQRAVRYLQQAGELALHRCANQEAIGHLTKGLVLLQSLPETPDRAQQELFLHAALGPAVMAVKGYASPDVERIYERARELCRKVGETPQLFPVLWGLFAFYAVRANFHTAREIAEQLLHLAQQLQDPALLVMSHEGLSQVMYLQGELGRAREHATQGVRLYDISTHRSLAFVYGEDPGVVCGGIESWALGLLGYQDQALRSLQKALSLGYDANHPLSLAQVFLIAAKLYQYRREGDAVQKWTAEATALASKEELPFFLAVSMILRGWVLTIQGQNEEGIALMRRGIAAYSATGAKSEQTHHLALLASAYRRSGQVQEGLTVLNEAFALVQQSGERYCEAELYRLKGELLLCACE